MESTHLINIIPNTMVDDFFTAGFLAGIVGYAYYLYINRAEESHLNILIGIYGALLSGAVGGLLAVVFDRAIELSIVVGLFNQFVYLAILKAVKSGNFLTVLKEVLIRYLTAGKG